MLRREKTVPKISFASSFEEAGRWCVVVKEDGVMDEVVVVIVGFVGFVVVGSGVEDEVVIEGGSQLLE